MPSLSEVCIIMLVALMMTVITFEWYLAQERAFTKCLDKHSLDTCMETFR
jgi:hypothetical protein